MRSVKNCVEGALPEGWRLEIFGSAARCRPTHTGCPLTGTVADVDLLIVYPPGLISQALAVRISVLAGLASFGVQGDIVLLDESEEAESRFAEVEHARELVACDSKAN